jgi:hypothetical protein
LSDTVTLFCEEGQHSWERERRRGKAPKNCPDHKPSRAKLSPEEAQRRRQEGRARAKAERDVAGVGRVLAFSEYLKRDAELFAAFDGGFIERHEYIRRRGPMPETPSGPDYAAAREAGVYRGAGAEDNELIAA